MCTPPFPSVKRRIRKERAPRGCSNHPMPVNARRRTQQWGVLPHDDWCYKRPNDPRQTQTAAPMTLYIYIQCEHVAHPVQARGPFEHVHGGLCHRPTIFILRHLVHQIYCDFYMCSAQAAVMNGPRQGGPSSSWSRFTEEHQIHDDVRVRHWKHVHNLARQGQPHAVWRRASLSFQGLRKQTEYYSNYSSYDSS